MGRSQRMKGKAGEQEAVQMLRALFPECRTKRAGGESASVDRGRDLLGTGCLCVQVKRGDRPNPLAALEEAKVAAAEDEIPLALVRQSKVGRGNSGEWVACLPAVHLVALMLAGGFGEMGPGETPTLAGVGDHEGS